MAVGRASGHCCTVATAVFLCLFLLTDAGAEAPLQPGVPRVSETVPLIPLPNAREPAPGLLTGGQPTDEQLRAAAAAGYKTIINLRPAAEMPGVDESGLVDSLGMDFVSIPIGGGADLTEENARRLDRALSLAKPGSVMIHCASGNRVGALLALRANLIQGVPGSEALSLGKAAGLTSLEDAVRQRLR